MHRFHTHTYTSHDVINAFLWTLRSISSLHQMFLEPVPGSLAHVAHPL